MALSESALSELRAAIDVGQGGDLIRHLAEWMMQQLIEAEAADEMGADRYERTEARTTERNGHRSRVLSTKAGDLSLKALRVSMGTSSSRLAVTSPQSPETWSRKASTPHSTR